MSTTRVADMSVNDLLELIRPEVREMIHEAVQEVTYKVPAAARMHPRPPLDLPVDDLGPWPDGLTLRREEMYD